MSERPKLGEILLRAGVIDEFQLRSALGEQARWGGRLGVTMIKLGFVDEHDMVRALASQLRLPVARLEGKRLDPEVLALVPVEIAEKLMCLPLFVKEEAGVRTLFVGMEDPCDLAAIDDVAFRTGMRVKPVLMGPSELCEAIDRFFHRPQGDEEVELTEPEPALDPPPAPEPEPERSQAPAARGEDVAAATAPLAEASSKVVLRALTQLLIEKGVIDKGGLAERVRALQQAEQGGD
jgi:type IV pilus assembly protein PilB